MWDALVLCAGTLAPIGRFQNCDFDDWSNSIESNFTGQMRILHELLPSRKRGSGKELPLVLFFAGGGTNCATPNFSSYTVSKIALIKMCELLDSEMPDTRFSILGPGWVETKIHSETIAARDSAGPSYHVTAKRLRDGDFYPMDSVLDCCDWIQRASHAVIGGRNISAVHDHWGSRDLEQALAADSNMYKLRRAGNEWSPQGT